MSSEVRTDDNVAVGALPPSAGAVSPSYAFYALVLLTVVNLFATIDYRVVGIVAEPIKNEFHLADWQIGMMTGFAFGLFYTVLGMPIARLADRGNRSMVIVASMTVWSIFTMLCGTVTSFLQLCLYRMGVGIGEGGATPPAHSIITEYTPKEKRATALAFHSMSIPLGALAGFAFGGLIFDKYGWRTAFVVAGAPGILLAILCAFTLKETRSKLKTQVAAAKADQPPFWDSLRILFSKRTYWMLMLTIVFKAFTNYGMQAFVVSFFLRNHADEVAQLAAGFGLKSVGFLGVFIGLIAGGCGAISIILGGWIADKAATKDVRNMMLTPAFGCLAAFPVVVVALEVHSAVLGLALLVIPYLLNGFGYGPVYAAMQSVVQPNMRATATAVVLFVNSLFGQALGPLLVGIMSDYFSNTMGMGSAEGVRVSLICSSSIAIPTCILYLLSRKTMRQEMIS
jgi:MFS family permease